MPRMSANKSAKQTEVHTPMIPKSESRAELPREEKKFYTKLSLPSLDKPILVRQLRYSEIKMLNSFTTKNDINDVYDRIVLAATDLDDDSLLMLPRIERYYLLMHIRSMSFIDSKISLEYKCKGEGCDASVDTKVAIERFAFSVPTDEFFAEHTFQVGGVDCSVSFRLDTYGDEIAISLDKTQADKTLLEISASVSEISIGGEKVYAYTNPMGLQACVSVLDENGILASQVVQELAKHRFGVKGFTDRWKCKKCKHENETRVVPDVFFFPT